MKKNLEGILHSFIRFSVLAHHLNEADSVIPPVTMREVRYASSKKTTAKLPV